MAECHSTSTPVDARAKLSALAGALVVDPTKYRSLAGALQYLTLTRLDLVYAVQQVCLFSKVGLHIGTGLVDKLIAYSYADWAG